MDAVKRFYVRLFIALRLRALPHPRCRGCSVSQTLIPAAFTKIFEQSDEHLKSFRSELLSSNRSLVVRPVLPAVDAEIVVEHSYSAVSIDGNVHVLMHQ